MDYLKNDQEYLDMLCGRMLINIGWSEPVSQALYDTMFTQMNSFMQGPACYDLAVINLLEGIGQSREQVELDHKQRIIQR